MFYEPDKNDHGLPFNPFKSIVVPRPIGWVSTVDREGRGNLAPYSQFNNLGYDPPYVMISTSRAPDGPRKHTGRNIVDTGEFVLNLATYELREAVRISSRDLPDGTDEAEAAGLEMLPSRLVKPRRVAASPIHLECQLYTTLLLPGRTPRQTHEVIIGKVVGIHIRDDVMTPEGKIDVLKLRPIARLGYFDYTSVETVFSMRPDGPNVENLQHGLEGRPRIDANKDAGR